MSDFRRILNGAPIQALVGATLLGVMVFLFVMASKTGHEEFNNARLRLGAVEILGLRMNGAMYPVLFEFQMDFDTLTDTEADLREAVEQLESSVHNPDSTELVGLMRQAIAQMEDFKSAQAVFRNSRAILTQMIAELSANPSLRDPASASDVHAVDSTYLNFIGRRDPASAQALHDTVAAVAARNAKITSIPEWQVLRAHSESLIRYAAELFQQMVAMLSLPIPDAIVHQRDRIEAELTGASLVAARYRIALLFVAIVALTFGALKATQVSRYVRMLNHAKDELESRVEERTKELSDANRSLLSEISQRERVEARLRIAEKLESLGQLAAGVAHEINNPTQYVNDNVSFVLDAWRQLAPIAEKCERAILDGQNCGDIDSETLRSVNTPFLRTEIPKALEAATAGLQRIGNIVRAMKDFSHPGGGALVPSDVNRAIDSTIVIARNEWKRVASVTTELDPDLPLVPCDISALNQVMLNLIVNAAQAIAETHRADEIGYIKVSTKQLPEEIEIAVEDDGPGVAEEIQDRIFDPFFTTKEVGKGTGQGLAIAYRVITEQHGGTLALERSTGRRGARFVIRLPKKIAAERAEASAICA